jgi:hypothetical protein
VLVIIENELMFYTAASMATATRAQLTVVRERWDTTAFAHAANVRVWIIPVEALKTFISPQVNWGGSYLPPGVSLPPSLYHKALAQTLVAQQELADVDELLADVPDNRPAAPIPARDLTINGHTDRATNATYVRASGSIVVAWSFDTWGGDPGLPSLDFYDAGDVVTRVYFESLDGGGEAFDHTVAAGVTTYTVNHAAIIAGFGFTPVNLRVTLITSVNGVVTDFHQWPSMVVHGT